MKLTPEQEEVVSIDGGSHLVLAPPGSGKTEMLSQRILHALAAGVDQKRMLCATFTNRAAFEMRDRVKRESAESGMVALPDVGNLHHFCHRFLHSVHRLRNGTHVLDEIEQLDFIKEIVDTLRSELRDGVSPSHSGVTVLPLVNGISNDLRRKYLFDAVERHFAQCARRHESPYPDFLAAVLVSHQARIGIPFRYRHSMPTSMYLFAQEGVLHALAIVYSQLKRKFHSVDFDDLVNETYLHLAHNPLADEKKFSWVQIDEVQDLNPLQWAIVKQLTALSAVSVYFGDVEQAIFSFLGASTFAFEDATAHCQRHYFKTNFRATPLLLEVLMRYSIAALDSDWEFLPVPASASCCSELVVSSSPVGASRAADGGGVASPAASRLFLSHLPPEGSIAAHVDHLLASVGADNVAILVRSNGDADIYEQQVKPLGYRLAKVSGHDLFAYEPMRDFLAFVSLFINATTRPGWTNLFRRFSSGLRSRTAARYFVRELFASGFDPMSLFTGGSPLTELLPFRSRRSLFALIHRRQIKSLRKTLKPAYEEMLCEIKNSRPLSFRAVFESFASVALGESQRYSLFELLPGVRITEEMLASPESYPAALVHARERIERFLRYTDHIYADDPRPFLQLLAEDWNTLSKLKEADLLVGDEKIVISTIHKAKGRQFDAVVVPDVSGVLAGFCEEDREELRRLLYVAMSRARRHLSLFAVNIGDGSDPEITAVRREIACIAQCFNPGYIDYYSRRSGLLSHSCSSDSRQGIVPSVASSLSSDWLFTWERLAAMNAVRQCDPALIAASFRLRSVPVLRMALKCLRHHPDRELSRRVFLKCVSSHSSVARSLSGCIPVAVDCLRHCAVYDREALSIVRTAALHSSSRVFARSVFRYLSVAPESSRRGTAAVLNPSAIVCCHEIDIASVLGDFLYSRFGDLRFSAASALADFGDSRWLGNIVGTSRDFEYLASVSDPSHENTLRILLENELPESYEERLRNILRARALRQN